MIKCEGLKKTRIGVPAYKYSCDECGVVLFGTDMIKHQVNKHSVDREVAEHALWKTFKETDTLSRLREG